MNFFDKHKQFLKNTNEDRLKRRWEVIFNPNKHIFHDKTVLDLGSHTGRWSAAALDLGARFVLGVEGRSKLVKEADRNLQGTFPASKFKFETDNLTNYLRRTGSYFDIILCMGVFYHVNNHCELFDHFRKLHPHYVILDTEVNDVVTGPVVQYKAENTALDLNSIEDLGDNRSWIGVPNNMFIHATARAYGFNVLEIPWSITEWNGCTDYLLGKRKSYLLTPK